MYELHRIDSAGTDTVVFAAETFAVALEAATNAVRFYPDYVWQIVRPDSVDEGRPHGLTDDEEVMHP